MRTFIVFIFLVFSFSIVALGQKYETSFYGEDIFRHSVQIPSKALKVLKQDKWVQRCFSPNSQPEFSRDWFEAANINLNNDNLPDLLVKGKDENNCINGNAISFWVFRKRRDDYELVLYLYTITVGIGKKRSNGYYNISASRSTGSTTYTTFYVFNGKIYFKKSTKEKPINC